MPNLALITGASSGIGMEFARYHASKGGDLIITARSADKLAALKAELEQAHAVSVQVIPVDLGADGGAQALLSQIGDATVDVLINNAGFGGHGMHIERDLAAEHAMIDLNVKALMTLSHAIGSGMAARGKGRILNVGSTAGMIPGPLQAVYFATKAFVRSYSLALAEELRRKGVTVTVLAPGYVETGFADAADLGGTGLVSGGGASAAEVAKFGYDAMLAGKLHVINEPKLSFALNWVLPQLPLRAVMSNVRKMQEKRT
ncbi:short-chain dehydrogenase [Loktanella sp. 3ANDIMAR09]|uniref:SDR family NAD(P)-dependent oxidoreductase n=1 Tax=Loktanella sp. 3ANDIMAR09 TaxID=1225657 RepID=UPI0006F9BDF7|nr:SDR family oxidoreductase [Loktanella sp. 3ANDIMAR09]KQI68093.1 short-chain dehydrogenase [Loktanella sp. 3ANDIMAR09]